VTCPGVFTIGDYGTNDGYVSITPLRIDGTDHDQREHLSDWALNLKLKS